MPFLTNEEIEQRKAAGIRMNRLNCGWNISSEDTARIVSIINCWEPKSKAEKRDKYILELAFIKDMNASQIARLNDPMIVGMGNRNHGEPLSVTSILAICHKYVQNTRKRSQYKCNTTNERHLLFLERQKRETERPKICAACGCTEDIELHHIIPLAKGGTNAYYNLVYLCHDCHMKLHHTIYDSLKYSEEKK